MFSSKTRGGGGDRYVAPVPADFFIWLHADAVKDALLREVDALKLDNAMSRDDHAPRLAKLRAALLDLERAEEAAIERAESQGTIIARRVDADPRAVLEIQFVGAATRAA